MGFHSVFRLQRVVGFEGFESLFEDVEQFVRHPRRAGADAFLQAARGIQRDRADPVVEQFAHQFARSHSRVADREEESVADRLLDVLVRRRPLCTSPRGRTVPNGWRRK